MALDAYEPCPCGSGKKLKFCCQALLPEMEKVTRLKSNNQTHVAITTLEELQQKHPDNPWVVTNLAALLVTERQSVRARELLADFLEKQPDHLFALALHASSSLSSVGYGKSKRAVYRAFQKCARTYPTIVSAMAVGIGSMMLVTGRVMAARQHLALAMRMATPKERHEIFLSLLELDGNREIPYPLRSVHALIPITGGDEAFQNEVDRASKLAFIGCFEPAARAFNKLAEQEPDNAAVWHNVGLCRAWDGDTVAAAEALHLAGQLHTDFATAVECETIAQLLDQETAQDAVIYYGRSVAADSVSRLLTQLDDHPQFVRQELDPDEDSDAIDEGLTAVYSVVDRSPEIDKPSEELTIAEMPSRIGEIQVFSGQEDSPPEVVLFAFEGEPLQTVSDLLFAASDQVTAPAEKPESAATEEEESDDETPPIPPGYRVVQRIPRETHNLSWRWYCPRSVSGMTFLQLTMAKWDEVVFQVWPQTPLQGLGGQTPADAAGDPDQRVALTAAAYVLDAYCEQRRYPLDIESLTARLGIESLPKIDPQHEFDLSTMSPFQLLRLPVVQLSDEQLSHTVNRAMLVHHGRFLYAVLTEALSRPECREPLELGQVYRVLVELCYERFRIDEALEWIEKCRNWSKDQPENAFELVLQNDMRELSFRLLDPDDPALGPMLKHMWEYYGTKLPEIREYLRDMVSQAGVTPPWSELQSVGAPGQQSGSTTAAGIWTPDAAAESTEKKLWLPGQD